MTESEESIRRAEQLLDKLERSRERLETTDDPETAIDVLSELAEIARQIEAEIARAKREAEAEAEADAEADA
jgi:poly(A) polymerase Pap1